MICDIIAAAGGKLVGKVRLHKAFYYAHLYYWQRGTGVLTSYPVVRLPFGPAIDEGPTLLAELVHEGKLRISTQPIGPYKESVFELTQSFQIDPTDVRFQAIEVAVEQVKSKTAVELSEETHLTAGVGRKAKMAGSWISTPTFWKTWNISKSNKTRNTAGSW